MKTPESGESAAQANSPDQKVLLSPKQSAAYLDIGTTKFYQILNSGQVAAKKLGGKTVVERAELDRFVNSLPAYTQTR